jgi:hypothetical protein
MDCGFVARKIGYTVVEMSWFVKLTLRILGFLELTVTPVWLASPHGCTPFSSLLTGWYLNSCMLGCAASQQQSLNHSRMSTVYLKSFLPLPLFLFTSFLVLP